jgi:hypothetical protein
MEAVVNGFIALVATVSTLAAIVGALSGLIAWRLDTNPILGSVISLGAYLLTVGILAGFYWLTVAIHFIAFPLSLTFLLAYSIARHLETRRAVKPLYAALAALISSLGAGYACVFVAVRSAAYFLYGTWTFLGILILLLAVRYLRPARQ